MPAEYGSFAGKICELQVALGALEHSAAILGAPGLAGREWFELLSKKLLPQLDLPPLLVVAIVGGTNIGKSAIFNHLAGENASAATPLASGTKHPVCLAPEGLDEPELLQKLFATFALHPWRSADDPLEEAAENRLFWRRGRRMPPRLLLLDAPDVDSDAAINWDRAKAIRQAADVLVAILTQQKYNDAAVKQFFRAAAAADKPIVVLFNQCELEADRDFWPRWLATFREETGASPELVYIVPHDRRAAEELRLPIYNAGADGKAPLGSPIDLRDELAALHFDAIKIRTFRGALLVVLDAARGAPGYLENIRRTSGEFAAAGQVLSARDMARVDWPALPAGVLVEEIRGWWNGTREPWSRRIHGFYRALGRGVTWPLRAAWASATGPADDPLAAFRKLERAAVISAVGKLLDELGRLAQVGNDTLRPRLLKLLSGHARSELLARVEKAHDDLPAVDAHYREFLRVELNAWREGNPRAAKLMQSLDRFAAAARPAISIGLFFTGLHFAGDLAGQAAVHAASQSAGHLAAEAAIAGGIAGGGEAIVGATSEGVGQAAGRVFLKLQSRYAQERAQWLADWLERELLGGLLGELRQGAEVPQSKAFRDVQTAMEQLQTLF
ncbi:MAG: 50S ribosome-binding GTPase [Pirellulales bacterium]|nr:50S ribosome-binding GTPase [Pirellulales bacterium]